MIKNYLKVAWRNLRRDKGFSFLNISGLAIGMGAAILIMLWIKFEVSFDREYAKSDRIYQMYNRDTFSGEKWAWGSTPKIMGPTIKKDYPEVEETVRVSGAGFLFSVEDKKINEAGLYADSTFFKVFDFLMVKGNAEKALEGTFNIVVSQEFARKMFDTEDAVGKTLKVDNSDIFTVTAVLKDMPENSRFKTSYFVPWSYLKKQGRDDQYWGNNSVQTYTLLKENASHKAFDDKVKNITRDHTKEGEKATTEVFSYPIARTYLYGKSENGQLVEGRIVTVRMFAIIAVFILVIACINFMNLTTAKSEKRAKEVGVRKVAGAGRSSLIGQFIGEGILLAFISGLLAIVLVQLSLTAFNNVTGKPLRVDYTDIAFWLQFIGFILFTGILAGSYPALYLSSFNPLQVLKGTFKSAKGALSPRKVLVVLQFTFAIVLIISTLIIQRQINYAQNRDLGYDRDQLIYVSLQGDIDKHYASIKQGLLASGSAESVSKSMSPITQQWSDSWGYKWPGSTKEDEKLDFIQFSTDADFTKVMGTELVLGRDIDINTYATDSSALLLNEVAVKKMRLKDPIGKIIIDGDEKWTVVGVVKDFIIASPFSPVEPMMVRGPGAWFNILHIRLNPGKSVADNIKTVQSVFEQFNPHYPFEYKFVDEEYAKKFDNTRRTGKLAVIFSILTIVISCLGLFGLSAYMAANRVKEIGVRKVLGASVGSIAVLLSKDFLKLISVAFVIATPIAWYLMTQWLKDYEYKISIEWWVFAITGLISIFIAIATVSFQAVKAARANPVKSLRTE